MMNKEQKLFKRCTSAHLEVAEAETAYLNFQRNKLKKEEGIEKGLVCQLQLPHMNKPRLCKITGISLSRMYIFIRLKPIKKDGSIIATHIHNGYSATLKEFQSSRNKGIMPEHIESLSCPMMADQDACYKIDGFTDKCCWGTLLSKCEHQPRKAECWERFKKGGRK